MDESNVLITFDKEGPARLLADYLQSQSIGAEYTFLNGEYPHGVSVDNLAQLLPEQQNYARQLAQEFVSNPDDNKYQQTAWNKGQTVELNGGGRFLPALSVRSFTGSPFTSAILILCIVTYVMAMFGMGNQLFSLFHIQTFAQLLETQQWWRLITPALFHFTILHIVFNLLWWWSLGGEIERTFGSSCLVLIFLATAILSNVGQLFMSGPNFGGLSGVVYGVVGFVWWIGWLRPSWGLSIPKPVVGFLLVWLVLGYADVLWVNMANTAHTVGLLSGCLAALIMTRLNPGKDTW